MPYGSIATRTADGRRIARELKAQGVLVAFAAAGAPDTDGCAAAGIEVVPVPGEHTAVHAADGYARMTGRPGCALLPGNACADKALATAVRAQSPLLLVTPSGTTRTPAYASVRSTAVDLTAVESLAHVLAHAEQPVVVLGSRVQDARTGEAAVELIRTLGLPTYADGAGRGTLAPGDPHLFQHSRAYALAGADVILVVGAPYGIRDFRAAYGRRLSPHATVVRIDPGRAGAVVRSVARAAAGHADAARTAGGHGVSARTSGGEAVEARAVRAAGRRREWLDELRCAERTAESLWLRQLTSDASPVHPFRLLAETGRFLTEDSVFIADDPRSAELAGRLVQPKSPGHWMDPGPLGTAGVGIPFALAVHRACANKETVVLFGDDPSSTATRDLDVLDDLDDLDDVDNLEVLVRHHLPFIGVVAHTGDSPFIDRARAHGCYGEDVQDPAAIRPALERARATGGPSLIGVRIDPDAYLPGSVNSPHIPSEQSDQPHPTDELRNK
ncbi:hypothetical protein H9Y04_13015 [Streptomyces sp. TRM66268-LWL]|uniref:Uncharacterized protein n=1 Tax=Streptomyces polyasparticus TaxID=2767826 RepID=A0ABR7SET2_9ACTN|nr:thiamine pyrophosphate-binding protein [Streptomyces polyasparticus]MBC9713492.1 hypothetical protein [Streptomyces polyasparticus]